VGYTDEMLTPRGTTGRQRNFELRIRW